MFHHLLGYLRIQELQENVPIPPDPLPIPPDAVATEGKPKFMLDLLKFLFLTGTPLLKTRRALALENLACVNSLRNSPGQTGVPDSRPPIESFG
jgi:hypothetical protein